MHRRQGKTAIRTVYIIYDKSDSIKVISYNGVTNASSAVVIQAMSQLFQEIPKIIIHRDRDFLVDDEIEHWSKEFKNRGMHIFCPDLPDIESYFVNCVHISDVYGISQDEASEVIEKTRLGIEKSMRTKFKDKRREAIVKFWRDGGGPITSEMWPDDKPIDETTTFGKELLKRLNEELPLTHGPRKNLLGKPSLSLSKELELFLSNI